MCRSIKTLRSGATPATPEEIEAAALQFVRKISGSTKPSEQNQAAFDRAVDEIAEASGRLLKSLVTKAPPRDRGEEARKAKEKWQKRAQRVGAG